MGPLIIIRFGAASEDLKHISSDVYGASKCFMKRPAHFNHLSHVIRTVPTFAMKFPKNSTD